MKLGPCPTPSAPRGAVKINSGLFGNLIACSAQNKRLQDVAPGRCCWWWGAARSCSWSPESTGGTRGGSRLGSSRLWAGGTWSPRGAPGMVPSPRHQAQVTSMGPWGAAAGRPSVCPLATVRLAALVLNLLIPGGIFSAPKGRAKSGGGSAAAPWSRGEGLHIRCLDPKTQHPQSPAQAPKLPGAPWAGCNPRAVRCELGQPNLMFQPMARMRFPRASPLLPPGGPRLLLGS